MTDNQDRIERSGWALKCDLPSNLRPSGDELISRLLDAVAGKAGPPLRRSRRSSTYRLRFRSRSGLELDVFAKLLDTPAPSWRSLDRWRWSAAARVCNITRQLVDAGVCAPPIWVWGRHRDGRELILTPRAPGKGPLRILADVSVATKRELLRRLGKEVARLHRDGFIHGDLTPFNIFFALEDEPRFTFLDHERTRRKRIRFFSRPFLRNLVQLGRFDLPGLSRTDRFRVLDGYLEAAQFRNRRRMVHRVSMLLRRRLARDGGFERVQPLAAFAKAEEGRDGRAGQNLGRNSRIQ